MLPKMKLLLLGLFLFLFLDAVCHGCDHTIVVPKAFRLGASEKVVLNLHGYNRATVSAFLQDLPERQVVFSEIRLVKNEDDVNGDPSLPIEMEMTVEPQDILQFRQRQRVVLVIEVTESNCNFMKEIEVLVSRESGYLFVITDRPIYKPGDVAYIRVFPLDQSMRPDSDTFVTIIVKTPDRENLLGAGVSKKRKILFRNERFIEDDYEIPTDPELGEWKVVVEYSSNGYQTTSEASFAVKQYVLPTFQVTVDLEKPYILTNDESINGLVRAMYSYGEPVTGSFYLSVKLRRYPGNAPIEIFKIPANFFLTARFRGGEEAISVPINTITNMLDEEEDISTLAADGATVFVEATVNGQASGVLESAMSKEIPFVTSPFLFTTERTSTYYTPGLVYKLRVDLIEAVGGRPATNIAVTITVEGNPNVVRLRSDDNGQINFQLDFFGNAPQRIRLQTNDPNVLAPDEASVELVILPYRSSSNRYLQISAPDRVFSVESFIQITFSFNEMALEEIRYFILARGSVVKTGVNIVIPGNSESSESVEVTQDMVPSARIIAYYFKNEEVISNSLWFDVKDQCKKELVIDVPEEVTPGQRIDIRLDGPSNALVSISGVDRASYFLFNRSRLTREKMFQRMEEYDQGCVRNGGRDGPSVFLEAGMTISSNTVRPQLLESLDCDADVVGKRKKRQVEENVKETVEYLQSVLEKCNLTAQFERKVDGDSCEVRANRSAVNYDFVPECHDVFLTECRKAELKRIFAGIRGLVGRSNNNPADVARSVAALRTNFQENLLFATVRLNAQGEETFRQKARDSITTFEIDAVSMQDQADGFCVAKTANMRVFKDVFIQLYAPYSLKKQEQANLKISVFNYNPDEDINVDVEVYPEEDSPLCTHFTSGQWSKLIQLGVPSTGTSSALLTVLPLSIPEGEKTSISLRIVSKQNRRILDFIKKDILIEESGVVEETYDTFAIDLKNDRLQTFDIKFDFPEKFVQDTRRCTLYAYANFLGPSIEVDPITQEPNSIESIFRKPHGCGEQNMLVCGPNVYAHMYLDSVGKITAGTPKWAASVARIETGYARERTFLSDASQRKAFAARSYYPPSTWLNAFVDKVFTKAKEYDTDLDITTICTSLEWLLTQQVDGTYFDEKRPPFHKEMHGAVGGRLTLTAYVVVSLIETQSRCPSELNLRIHTAATNAISYLVNNKDDETFMMRPFGLALLSYTLALNDPTTPAAREIFARLLNVAIVEDGKIHWVGRPVADIAGTDIHAYWYNRKPQAVSIEATAYALLAQIAMVRFENPPPQSALDRARRIALWLICQRNEGGAFISTQDTVIGLQALATYQMWIAGLDEDPPVIDYNLQFVAPGTVWNGTGHQISLNEHNVDLRKEVQVPPDVIKNARRVSVTAIGEGEGVLSYRCLYRTIVEEEACHFDINYDVTITNEREAEDENEPLKIKLTIKISKPRGAATEITMLEVGLLSGFVPIEQSIAQWAIPNVADGLVERYDITNVNVILYLREVDENPLVINFDLEQNVRVSRPEPAKIKVYDYYESSVRCGVFYTLPDNTPDIRTSNCRKVRNNENPADAESNREEALCKCAEGGCPKCRLRDHQLDRRQCLQHEDQAECSTCEDGSDCEDVFKTTCRSNYGYLINVTSVEAPRRGDIFYKFSSEVLQVIKRGDDAQVQRSNTVDFIIRNDCYETCIDERLAKKGGLPYTIIEGIQLFITGANLETFFDRNEDIQHEYRLDNTARVERHIPTSKCEQSRRDYYTHKLNCPDQARRRNPKQQAKCDNWKKFVDACDNFQEMVRQVKQGCDL